MVISATIFFLNIISVHMHIVVKNTHTLADIEQDVFI